MNTASQAPQWADSSRGLGRVIESLISIGLLRRPLFFQARQLIIRTAERNGIPWRARRQQLQQANVLIAEERASRQALEGKMANVESAWAAQEQDLQAKTVVQKNLHAPAGPAAVQC